VQRLGNFTIFLGPVTVHDLAICRLERTSDFLAVTFDSGIVNAVRVAIRNSRQLSEMRWHYTQCFHMLNLDKSRVRTKVPVALHSALAIER
jgi:hypothetical protein